MSDNYRNTFFGRITFKNGLQTNATGVASLARVLMGGGAGTITVDSNAGVATFSSTNVKSDSLIFATVLSDVSSLTATVGSRVDGVSAAVRLDAVDAANELTVAWAILK